MAVELTNESKHSVNEARLMDVARAAMVAMNIDPEAELSIAVVDNDVMEKLHVDWMDLPGPTDVLSFPMDELEPGKPGEPPVTGMLGDIVIAPEFATAQALEAGREPQAELDLLMVHGVLHLLGFDHEEPEEHQVMFDLQADILTAYESKGSPS